MGPIQAVQALPPTTHKTSWPTLPYGNTHELNHFNFLQSPGVLITDLQPNESGIVRIPYGRIGQGNIVQLIAIDEHDFTTRQFILPNAQDLVLRDARQRDDLRYDRHYAGRKTTANLIPSRDQGDATTRIENAAYSEVEVIGDIQRVFDVFQALSSNDTLNKFSFITHWSSFPIADKLDHYSSNACHEVCISCSQISDDAYLLSFCESS
jgi:hypothetical protein